MNISHGTKLVGSALAGFTLFACGSTPAVTRGTVVGATYDPGHATSEKKCTTKVKTRCVKWKVTRGWDDADYDLRVSDGKSTSTIEVDDIGVYQACRVGTTYPACAGHH